MALAPTNSRGAALSGVNTFNGRNGAVVFSAGDSQGVFTATGQVVTGTGAGTGTLALPPSFLIGYDQITAAVNVTTNVAPGTTVITCASHTFDGSAVMVHFYCPHFVANTGATFAVYLTESGTQLFNIGQRDSANGGTSHPASLWAQFTPSAGAHSYLITATSSSGTSIVDAGTGSAGATVPTFVRFLKA